MLSPPDVRSAVLLPEEAVSRRNLRFRAQSSEGLQADDNSVAKTMILDPTLAATCIALIDPKVFDARELFVGSPQQQRHRRTVLHIARVPFGEQHKAASIDQNVAFAAINAFGAVIAAHTVDAGRPDRLAIDDACAGMRVAPDGDVELLAQDSVHVFPGAIETPQTEIVISSLPGWELVREQPPGAATPNQVEDGVQISRTGCMRGRPTFLGGCKSGPRRANSASVRSVRYGRRRVRHRLSYRQNRLAPPVVRQFLVVLGRKAEVTRLPHTALAHSGVMGGHVGCSELQGGERSRRSIVGALVNSRQETSCAVCSRAYGHGCRKELQNLEPRQQGSLISFARSAYTAPAWTRGSSSSPTSGGADKRIGRAGSDRGPPPAYRRLPAGPSGLLVRSSDRSGERCLFHLGEC